MTRSPMFGRAVVLAPRGRDSLIAADILREAGIPAELCPSLPALIEQLDEGAGFVVVTEEALATADISPLAVWLARQSEWSDLPFVLLTLGGGGLERNPAAKRYLDILGNVTFLERPFHPTTLVSLGHSALRGRRRQYEAKARLEVLRENEARQTAALGIARLGTYEWDVATGYVAISARGREMFGFSPDEIITLDRIFDSLDPNDLPRVRAAVSAAAEAQGRIDLTYRIRRPGGEVRILSSLGESLPGADGRTSVVGVLADATDQVRADEALRDSEARYRTLFENIDEGFCVIEFVDGPHGRCSDYVHVEANPAYAAHAGIPDVVGQHVRDMVPEEAEGWIGLYRHVLETGEPMRFERQLVATQRDLELAAFRVEPASRRQVAVVFRDITDRKQAERALRELNETLERRVADALAEQKLFADIVDGTDAFVHVVDLNYRWLAVNRAAADEFERLFGHRPRAGQSMMDLFDESSEPRETLHLLWTRALGGEEFTVVTAFADPVRGRKLYEMKFNALRDKSGTFIGAYQFAYDVTERTLNQERLAQTEEALRQAQKMEAVGQLTGGVAHDFNNLLTVIKSSSDLLRRPGISEERRRRYIDAISVTVERAAKLTGQLLAFARRQALKPEVFDAGERVSAIAEMLRTVLGSRIELVVDLPQERCMVEADASQFETALVNMAVNARDAMAQEGLLTITVSPETAMPAIRGEEPLGGPVMAVTIADTGTGIAPDRLSQIFEPFYTTKEVGKGTGLGLSQVYGFAKQSGGNIAVASEIGVGTAFTLYLPLARSHHSDTSAPENNRAHQAVYQGHGRRVLIVEDNAEVGTFTMQLLQDLGYETTWASSADEALSLLSAVDGFDAVFSDVVMPRMNGVELGREIRRLYPDLPVILTSGYSDVLAQDGRHGFELLHKPYAAEDVSRVLRRATRKRR